MLSPEGPSDLPYSVAVLVLYLLYEVNFPIIIFGG